ncbi:MULTISPECIES: helix-turn-helix domain-containing protein [Polyangium]|uniref:XRE family transcriptional regulator n=2 Tax=Polyangium TaxID=55 RepID=A0A4U1IV04_9BACT|nr:MULTISPECIES: helix-turn-helix domain-containing protein [Polyangium]MDI1432799.1 helix-turn-helix domain-containing protein [Polyangium sorediatum]TKC97928.1 XRE family transcriptional regulator [Polyangium fumosum]
MKRTSRETQAQGSKTRAAARERADNTSGLPEPYAGKLGARMRDLRLERGLSLASLREAGGLTPSQMSSAERGRVRVTMGTVVAVARALDVPPFVLLAFPDEDPLSAVLEEIRQAYGGDMRRVSAVIEERTSGLLGKKRGRGATKRSLHE